MIIDIGSGGMTRKEKHQAELMDVYVLDYGDNYHRLDNEPSSELERAVRGMKRRYRNIWDYKEAMLLYNEYMNYLYSLHGNKELFKLKNKSGNVPQYVPGKPKLKNTETNKFIKKHGIVVGRVEKNLVKVDQLNEFIEETQYDEDLEVEKITDISKKKLAELGEDDDSPLMKLKKNPNMTNLDFLDEYFKVKNGKPKKPEEHHDLSLTEMVKGDYLDDIADDGDEVIFYEGRYITRRAMDEVDVYHQLNELGWNSYRLMRRTGNKTLAKILKPKKAKKKKHKKNRNKSSNSLVNILTDGGYTNYEEFEKEMLTMYGDTNF